MRKTFVHGVGGVLSADIAVPDHDRELEFYSKILTTGDAPFWREDLKNNFGTPVIGLGARTPEYDSLPLQWMPHIQVADVAASVECAIALGGNEIMHAQNEDGHSQWAVLADKFGAAFGIVPAVAEEAGATGQNEREGCISWLSLATPDATSSRDFYRQVIGWKAMPVETDDACIAKFEMQIDDETAAAEICQFQSGQDVVPSVWLIHLPVGDLFESLGRVKEGGGKVIKELAKGECAVVRDPVGVYLALQEGA